MQRAPLTRRRTRAGHAMRQYPIQRSIMNNLTPGQRANLLTALGVRSVNSTRLRGQYRTHQHRMVNVPSGRGSVATAYRLRYQTRVRNLNRRRR